MYKKEMTYVDFNDNERTETFYFHLSKAELAEMEWEQTGGLESYIKRITETQDRKELIKLFKELILKSYGEKSLDGKRFIKSQELRNEFEQTEAYSDLFILLATDSDEAVAFVNGITPKLDKPKDTPELKIVQNN